MAYYPFTGFHFKVEIDGLSDKNNDVSFQDVTGLSVDIDLETYNEGGENRFVHRLPIRSRFSDLVLKRGMTATSDITDWCREAVENFNYQPKNILVSLLDENHSPLASWSVVNAIPIRYDILGINAEQSQIVIESITLRYEYYKSMSKSGNAASSITDQLPSTISISIP